MLSCTGSAKGGLVGPRQVKLSLGSKVSPRPCARRILSLRSGLPAPTDGGSSVKTDCFCAGPVIAAPRINREAMKTRRSSIEGLLRGMVDRLEPLTRIEPACEAPIGQIISADRESVLQRIRRRLRAACTL